MRLLCKIVETLKIDEESNADNQSHWIKNVLVLYTGMSLMLWVRSLYCDMSQLFVILAFRKVSGLNKLETFIIFGYNSQLYFTFYYIKVAFLMSILQCATRSKCQILIHYTKQKKYSLQFVKDKSIYY